MRIIKIGGGGGGEIEKIGREELHGINAGIYSLVCERKRNNARPKDLLNNARFNVKEERRKSIV